MRLETTFIQSSTPGGDPDLEYVNRARFVLNVADGHGADGVGIASMEVRNRKLFVTLTSGAVIDLGEIYSEENLPLASDTRRGLASFNIEDFIIEAGHISLKKTPGYGQGVVLKQGPGIKIEDLPTGAKRISHGETTALSAPYADQFGHVILDLRDEFHPKGGRDDLDLKARRLTFDEAVTDKGIRSEEYVSGALGAGGAFRRDPVSGKWVIEGDRLHLRESLHVPELILDKIRAVKGALIVSSGGGKVASVVEGETTYVLTLEDEHNTFVVGDFIRCQVFSGTNVKFYWVSVLEVVGNTITVSKAEFEGEVPAGGDEIVQLGNDRDPARQSAIYITASDSGAPMIDVLDGISSRSLSGCMKVRLGNLNGITDTTLNPHGYGLYALNCFLSGSFRLTNGMTLDEYVDEAGAQIEHNVTSNLSAAGGAIELSVKTEVGKVQIGGTNLIRKSILSVDSAGYEGFVFWLRLSEPLVVGTTYIFSTDITNGGSVYVTPVYGIGTNQQNIQIGVPFIADFQHTTIYMVGDNASSIGKKVKLECGNKATGWSPAPEDINAKIDGIQIGGTNLYGRHLELRKNLADAAIERTDTGFNLLGGNGINNFSLIAPFTKGNDTYTVSFDVAANNDYNFELYIDLNSKANKAIRINTPKQHVVIAVNIDNIESNNYINFQFGWVYAYITNFKIEKGNKATDWSPAPEDMASKTELEAKIAVTEGHISAAVSGIQIGGRNFALDTTNDRRWTDWGDKVQCRYLLSNDTPNLEPLTIRFTTTNVGSDPQVFGIGWGTQTAWSRDYFSIEPPVEGKTFEYHIPKENQYNAIWIYFNTGTTVHHLSVQSGNKPTDWSPAPEDVSDKLLRTGVDIELGKITLDSGTGGAVVVKNGDQTAAMFENGKIKAQFIDVDNLTARRVDAQSPNSPSHITIDPAEQKIRLFNNNGRNTMTLSSGITLDQPILTITEGNGSAWNFTGGGIQTDAGPYSVGTMAMSESELSFNYNGNRATFGSGGITLSSGISVDISGPLGGGRVTPLPSTNQTLEKWGAKLAFSGATRIGSGRYRITHSIGHTEYYVAATIVTPNANWWGTAGIINKQPTYFDVGVVDFGSDGNDDHGFEFVITGKN